MLALEGYLFTHTFAKRLHSFVNLKIDKMFCIVNLYPYFCFEK